MENRIENNKLLKLFSTEVSLLVLVSSVVREMGKASALTELLVTNGGDHLAIEKRIMKFKKRHGKEKNLKKIFKEENWNRVERHYAVAYYRCLFPYEKFEFRGAERFRQRLLEKRKIELEKQPEGN